MGLCRDWFMQLPAHLTQQNDLLHGARFITELYESNFLPSFTVLIQTMCPNVNHASVFLRPACHALLPEAIRSFFIMLSSGDLS